jgi:hypothetical protein
MITGDVIGYAVLSKLNRSMAYAIFKTLFKIVVLLVFVSSVCI